MCGLRSSSSHALRRRVRNLSAATLTPLARSTPPSSSSTGATSSKTSSHRARGVFARPSRPFPLARSRQEPSPPGPSDAFPSTLAWPAPLPCGSFTDRPGLPHPARLASRICQPYFRSVRPWVPSLQRFLPTRRRPLLSDRAVPHAVSHLAMSRLRGFELQVDAFSRASVVHACNGSLLSWSFPPFEDDLPASPHTSAGLLSWASIMFPSPPIPARLPPRFVTSPSTRALFRVSENRKCGPVSPDPLRGVLADASILFRQVEGCRRLPVDATDVATRVTLCPRYFRGTRPFFLRVADHRYIRRGFVDMPTCRQVFHRRPEPVDNPAAFQGDSVRA